MCNVINDSDSSSSSYVLYGEKLIREFDILRSQVGCTFKICEKGGSSKISPKTGKLINISIGDGEIFVKIKFGDSYKTLNRFKDIKSIEKIETSNLKIVDLNISDKCKKLIEK